MKQAGVDRPTLTGVMICGIFGIAWAAWGASGLSSATAIVVRIVGVLLGVLIIIRSARLRRSAPAGRESMFKSSRYWLVLAAEIAAIAAGAVILRATGHQAYISPWIAMVVGVHFLGFGRLFAAAFYAVGAAVIIAAIAGAAVGLAGAGTHGIEATTGLITAASLFAAGGWRLAQADIATSSQP